MTLALSWDKRSPSYYRGHAQSKIQDRMKVAKRGPRKQVEIGPSNDPFLNSQKLSALLRRSLLRA